MPVVLVYHHPKITPTELTSIIPAITTTVASQLTCTEKGKDIIITPEMVKIRFMTASTLDTHMHDLHIEIEARAFDARKPHIDAYSIQLADAIAPLLTHATSISIWYKLCQASWHARTVETSL